MRSAMSRCSAVGTDPFRTTVLVSAKVSTLMSLASTVLSATSAFFTSKVSIAAPTPDAGGLAGAAAGGLARSSLPRTVRSQAAAPRPMASAAIPMISLVSRMVSSLTLRRRRRRPVGARHPVGDLALRLVTGPPVTLLEPPGQHLRVALHLLDVVVGELGPVLPRASLPLF